MKIIGSALAVFISIPAAVAGDTDWLRLADGARDRLLTFGYFLEIPIVGREAGFSISAGTNHLSFRPKEVRTVSVFTQEPNIVTFITVRKDGSVQLCEIRSHEYQPFKICRDDKNK